MVIKGPPRHAFCQACSTFNNDSCKSNAQCISQYNIGCHVQLCVMTTLDAVRCLQGSALRLLQGGSDDLMGKKEFNIVNQHDEMIKF